MTDNDLDKLAQLCVEFIDNNNITCSEAIYQTDRVIENAYEFIDRICQIVGFKEIDEEDDLDD